MAASKAVGRLLAGTKIRKPYTGPGGVAALAPGKLVLGEAGVVNKRVGASAKGL